MLNSHADWRRVATSSGCTAVALALGVLLGDRTDGDWGIALSTWVFVTLAVVSGECLVRPARTKRPPPD